MTRKKQKVIAIFIAYNAAKTLKDFYKDFPKHLVDEMILVDDASRDRTFEIAKRLGIPSYKNPINRGYGGNLKRSLAIALSRGGDIFIDLHPDSEYKPSCIPEALKTIEEGAEFVLGNRFSGIDNPLKSGMYIWKLIPIRLLNFIDKLVLGADIDDFHQGFRVYTRKLFEKVNFEANSNDFLFSFELIAQSILRGVRLSQVPVETRYVGRKRGATMKNSVIYSLGTFKVLFLFILAKLGLRIEIFQKPKGALGARIVELAS